MGEPDPNPFFIRYIKDPDPYNILWFQEKRSSGKRRRTGKMRTTADRSGPLPAIKPKTDDQGFANHETVFIGNKIS